MKLLDITEFYSPLGGGVRTYLDAKAQWIEQQPDIDHVIVVPGGRDTQTVWGRSRVHVLGGPPVPASPGYHFLVRARRVRQIIQTERPDVIEVGSPFLAPPLVGFATKRAAARIVGFYHCDARRVYVEWGLRRWPATVRRLAGNLLDGHLSKWYRRCDAVVAASGVGAQALESLGVGNVHVVPLGVDTKTFHPGARNASWRRDVGAADEQPVALYVGRLSADKRLDVVLGALPQLHSTLGLKLVLMGEGHLKRELQERARAAPETLAVLPFEPDSRALARAYASADLYIAPFPHETFGLSLVEAMACGLPVVHVASATPDAMLRAAEWSTSYRLDEPDSVVRAVRTLLAQDLRALGRAAREWVTQQFGWEATFRRLLQVYGRPVPVSEKRIPASATA